jgi:acetyl-CoA carboxylase biotin carboxyl carrier protein
MNTDDVKALTQILLDNGLTTLEVTEGEKTIKVEKAAAVQATAPTFAPYANENTNNLVAAQITDSDNNTLDYNKLIEVTSPIVGIFYSSSAPDADPFVHIGSKVKKGDVLCIIEAMKLMNEITAETDGEIVDICMKNGDIAEFGQVLFKIF